jgi:ribosomal protein S18 acetylase RimI-like enzyme
VREVRVLGVEDWGAWRDIRLRALQDSPGAFGSTYAREVGFSDQTWRDRLADAGSVCVLVADEGSPVGMGGGFSDGPGLLHVVAMWVEPSARRRGVGRLVLDALRDWAGERGLRLHLDVYSGNPGARRCYESYGFEPTGETRPVREGSTEVAERMLLPPSPRRPVLRPPGP